MTVVIERFADTLIELQLACESGFEGNVPCFSSMRNHYEMGTMNSFQKSRRKILLP